MSNGEIYIMPDGTFPAVPDASDILQPAKITEENFINLCCKKFQWLREFQWDCEEAEWEEIGEPAWVEALDEPFQTEDPCVRLVYGEAVKCTELPRPDLPPEPDPLSEEEIEACCEPPEPSAPESCPCEDWPPEEWPCGGLSEKYTVIEYESTFEEYDEPNCQGNFEFGIFDELKDPIEMTAVPGSSCTWTGTGIVIEGRDSFDQEPTQEEVEYTFTLQLSTALNEQNEEIPIWKMTFSTPAPFSTRNLGATRAFPEGGYDRFISSTDGTLQPPFEPDECELKDPDFPIFGSFSNTFKLRVEKN